MLGFRSDRRPPRQYTTIYTSRQVGTRPSYPYPSPVPGFFRRAHGVGAGQFPADMFMWTLPHTYSFVEKVIWGITNNCFHQAISVTRLRLSLVHAATRWCKRKAWRIVPGLRRIPWLRSICFITISICTSHKLSFQISPSFKLLLSYAFRWKASQK